MLSAMSRWYLGLVSAMRRSWFCVAWVVSRGVTVMSRSCFRVLQLVAMNNNPFMRGSSGGWFVWSCAPYVAFGAQVSVKGTTPSFGLTPLLT